MSPHAEPLHQGTSRNQVRLNKDCAVFWHVEKECADKVGRNQEWYDCLITAAYGLKMAKDRDQWHNGIQLATPMGI